jgi:hypothetical protein
VTRYRWFSGWVAGAVVTAVISSMLASLEAQPFTQISAAPFRVVDRRGAPILSVAAGRERGLLLYGSTAAQGASLILEAQEGGAVVAQSQTARRVRLDGAALRFFEGVAARGGAAAFDRARVSFGPGSEGGYALQFFAANGKRVAAIGASRAGSGAIVVADPQGIPRVVVRTNGNAGLVGIVDDALVRNFVALTEGASGGGRLEVTDVNHVILAEAGSEGRVGVVRAGPRIIPTIGTMGSSPSVLTGR